MILEPSAMIGMAGLAVGGYALILIALWRQPRAIKWFGLALVTIGLGYLSTTEVPTRLTKSTIGVPR